MKFCIKRLLIPLACLSLTGPVFATNPVVKDDRLELKLFAKDPDIVTPIGLAIDSQDRVYVLESHTHIPPSDYQGHSSDIIKVFEDKDYDGAPDRMWHFVDGIEAGMNLGFAPDGALYVCAAREVWAFYDDDGDAKCDRRKRVLWVETGNRYPHSSQMGIAFTKDGWMYISRGNTGSHGYIVHGSDGSKISGFGDGGSVYRARIDGNQLEEVAIGFWNSMDLKFDSHGRLMLVDNDPDARGPNRLVHVVEQGDYGHKSVFGGGGNHPYQGWDGTLPGTLGYAAGTGEAPSGLIDTDRTSLPEDYRDQYLVTIWNENSIARYSTKQNGVSITADSTIWMQGDQDFRPVALEADGKGNVYITDWALVDYPNHGKGAIWRVSTKANVKRLKPQGYFDQPDENAGAREFASLITSDLEADFERLEKALSSEDPFLRHAAVVALARPVFADRLRKAASHKNAEVRLGALLALRRSGLKNPDEVLKQFLSDPEENVRRTALMWIGEEGYIQLKPEIERAIQFEEVSAMLFETYLATHEVLDPDFIEAIRARKGKANAIRRKLDPLVVESIMRDESRSERVRGLAVIHLKNVDDERNLEYLRILARTGTPTLQREAIRSLSQESRNSHGSLFTEIAMDGSQPVDIRAEALLALSREALDTPEVLVPLLDDEEPIVQMEAVRTLRAYAWQGVIKTVFEKKHEKLKRKNLPLLEQFEYALFPPGVEAERVTSRPETVEDWHKALAKGGDPTAGERVFFSQFTQCTSCHRIQNRGRRIGPELSNIGQSLTRKQIIQSIINPSDQYAPQYQAWYVELNDGESYQGLQLDHRSEGDIELYTTEGKTRHFKAAEIESYGVMTNSLMPDGLEQTMTVSELRDLVAFLDSLN